MVFSQSHRDLVFRTFLRVVENDFIMLFIGCQVDGQKNFR